MPKKILSLKQLPSLFDKREVTLKINGEEYLITLKKRSYKRWMEVDKNYPQYEPYGTFNNQTGRREYELDHPISIANRTQRNNWVTLMRLADAIVEDFPAERKTLGEKAEYLSEILDEETIATLFFELSAFNQEAQDNVNSTKGEVSGADDAASGNGDVGDDKVGEDA